MEKQPLNRIKVMLAERMLTNKELAEMHGKDHYVVFEITQFLPRTETGQVLNSSSQRRDRLLYGDRKRSAGQKEENQPSQSVVLRLSYTERCLWR